MKQVFTMIFLVVFSIQGLAQDLERRASWQAKIEPPNAGPGAIITSVEADSPLQKIGLQAGDIILRVNGVLAGSSETWTSIVYALRANRPTEILVRRKGKVFEKMVTLNALAYEEHVGLVTSYEHITNDYGIRQRVIITQPENKVGKQPAIFLVQGLSCSTIEKYSGRGGNWAQHINSIVENSGMVVMRVDKPGVGDSEGDCAETDFFTELSGYKAAIRLLKSKDYVDPDKIVVYGASMGSALAPLLANRFDLAGVISDGTFFKTWYEHMLEIERRIRQMSGDDESTIVKKMNEAYIPLYYGMLIEKKSYQEVVEANPVLKDYNYHSPRHMYGRPVEYYHQLQDLDLAGEWEKIKVPVRILYGANDWIMSEFDNRMIIDVLQRNGHQDHELLIYPGLDHWNTIHETPKDSFLGNPGIWDENVPQIIINWCKAITG
ncbi:MAG: alpha/beta fold hydrolase [Bacteroidota bacterium]